MPLLLLPFLFIYLFFRGGIVVEGGLRRRLGRFADVFQHTDALNTLEDDRCLLLVGCCGCGCCGVWLWLWMLLLLEGRRFLEG